MKTMARCAGTMAGLAREAAGLTRKMASWAGTAAGRTRTMAKRATLAAMLCLMVLPALSAASFKAEREPMEFDSETRLAGWDFSPVLDDPSYWERCEVWLLTATKGDPVFTWFGHSSLMAVLPDGRKISFDYGLFSYDEDFYGNFIMGRLWYGVAGCWLEQDIAHYDAENRSIRAERLDLPPEKKAAVIRFLFDNIKPGNSNYLYHYYLDNCSTRIRDIVDHAVDGGLRRWAEARQGESFRRAASRSLYAGVFWDWLLNFLQSGRIDNKATLWDEMFLPSVLEKALKDIGLVAEEKVLLDNSATDKRPPDLESYSFARELPLLALTLALCLASALCSINGWRKAYGALGFAVYLVLGLLSALLCFLCLFTDHDVSWFNENLVFINPLLLWFAVSNLRFALGRTSIGRLGREDRLMVGLSAVPIVLKLLLPDVFVQRDLQQLLTVVPIYLARAFVPFGRRGPKPSRR